jgi:hypothetical protein
LYTNTFAYARAVAYIIYMNRLSIDERAQILAALVEGNSIRSTCRMLGREKRTVKRLLSNTRGIWQDLVELGMLGLILDDAIERVHRCYRESSQGGLRNHRGIQRVLPKSGKAGRERARARSEAIGGADAAGFAE